MFSSRTSTGAGVHEQRRMANIHSVNLYPEGLMLHMKVTKLLCNPIGV